MGEQKSLSGIVGTLEMEREIRGDGSFTKPSCNGAPPPQKKTKQSKHQNHTDAIQLPTRHFSRAKHHHIPFPQPKHLPGKAHSSVPLCPEDTKQIKPCRPKPPSQRPTRPILALHRRRTKLKEFPPPFLIEVIPPPPSCPSSPHSGTGRGGAGRTGRKRTPSPSSPSGTALLDIPL